jgi:hypothetical protein
MIEQELRLADEVRSLAAAPPRLEDPQLGALTQALVNQLLGAGAFVDPVLDSVRGPVLLGAHSGCDLLDGGMRGGRLDKCGPLGTAPVHRADVCSVEPGEILGPLARAEPF